VEALLEDLMDAAARHADYADVRHVATRREQLSTRNGALDELDSDESDGIGLRVRIGAAWGFACVRGGERDRAEAALERALDLARVQPAGPGVPLAPAPPARGSWASPAERDPFGVPLEDKLAVLFAADAELRTTPGVSVTTTRFEARATTTLFASSEGALCEQRLTECGGGIAALAVAEGESQIRSYPASHGGHVAQAGYEHFLELGLPGRAPAVAEEAAALLRAPACPAGRTTLVLAGEQLGLQIHESIGHAVELDRVLGRETSYAGGSYVGAGSLGSLVIGSPHVSFTADASTPGGLGSFRWDDEGVEASAVPIVRGGVLTGLLSSRETAAEIGLERSGGCARADGFARQPIVRMTNVNLEPGEAGSLEDLIADTGEGVLIETNRSWSIDDRRLHFQFEGEAAWELRGGKRGRLLRNPSYAGVTPELWGRCDAICSPPAWGLNSLLDCGKGEPGQIARVSHGAAPARFRDVEVGVA
jgi:TldD protein